MMNLIDFTWLLFLSAESPFFGIIISIFLLLFLAITTIQIVFFSCIKRYILFFKRFLGLSEKHI